MCQKKSGKVPAELKPASYLIINKRDDRGRGRGFFANRLIKPGEIILTEVPAIIYPTSLTCVAAFCAWCFRVLPSESCQHICQKCNYARFCSPQCLSKLHPPLLCQAFPSLFARPDHLLTCPPELLFLLSALSFKTDQIAWMLALHLNSSFTPDHELVKNLNSQLLALLPNLRIPDITRHSINRQFIALLLSTEKCNSFAIRRSRQSGNCGVGDLRAKCIYFRTSFINHDCMPNACAFVYIDAPGQENTKLMVKTLHEIPKGTEICISYVALDTRYPERQKILREHYGFECDCMRCSIESQWKESHKSAEEEKMRGRKRKGVVLEMPEEKVHSSKQTWADWAQLNSDLLHIISMKLCDRSDFIMFRAVCKAWRDATNLTEAPPHIPGNAYWLYTRPLLSWAEEE